MFRRALTLIAVLLLLTFAAGCTVQPVAEQPTGPVTLYSGRAETLIGPVLEKFTEKTGIKVNVKYGDTGPLAATILEEGDKSPADVFLAQDAGALGAVAKQGRFQALPQSVLNRVEARFRSPQGEWVGVSGRARVVVYNTEKVKPEQIPATAWGFTEPQWKGKVAWAPTNASFQAAVSAMRLLEGEEKAQQWLDAMVRNGVKAYKNNTSIVEAVGAGEVEVGLVNHYYLYNVQKTRGKDFPAANHWMTGGDAHSIVNVSGAGILKTAKQKAAAEKLIEFLLSEEAQKMLAENNFEYPLVQGVATSFQVKPLNQVNTPRLDLNDLFDVSATQNMLRKVGAIP